MYTHAYTHMHTLIFAHFLHCNSHRVSNRAHPWLSFGDPYCTVLSRLLLLYNAAFPQGVFAVPTMAALGDHAGWFVTVAQTTSMAHNRRSSILWTAIPRASLHHNMLVSVTLMCALCRLHTSAGIAFCHQSAEPFLHHPRKQQRVGGQGRTLAGVDA